MFRNVYKFSNNIYRLLIPFEEIYATIYIVIDDNVITLIDIGSYDSDIDDYLVPAIKELGYKLEDIKYVLLSHAHLDHSGGLRRFLELHPNVNVKSSFDLGIDNFTYLKDGEVILNNIKCLHLPGHTIDSYGFLDIKSNTLLAADVLQQEKLEGYGYMIEYEDLYDESIDRLINMDIDNILSSHDFLPLGHKAIGKKEVKEYLQICLKGNKHINN